MLSMRTGGLALPLLLFAVAPLTAEPLPAEKIKVSVVAIFAHNRDDKVDPRLKCIAEEIGKAVPQLKGAGFKMGKMTCKHLNVGVGEKFDLIDDQFALVTLLSVVQTADKENLIQLKLTPPGMGEVTYETTCGRFLPIITKYRTGKNNDVLILAIRVQPCQK